MLYSFTVVLWGSYLYYASLTRIALKLVR